MLYNTLYIVRNSFIIYIFILSHGYMYIYIYIYIYIYRLLTFFEFVNPLDFNRLDIYLLKNLIISWFVSMASSACFGIV